MDFLRIEFERLPEDNRILAPAEFRWRVRVAVQEDEAAMQWQPPAEPGKAEWEDLGSGVARSRPEALRAALDCMKAGQESIEWAARDLQSADEEHAEEGWRAFLREHGADASGWVPRNRYDVSPARCD